MELSSSSTDIIQYANITDYNDFLIKNDKTNLTIIEYLEDINNKFYKINISFMEEFMELVDRDDFCISHDYLIKYKVSAETDTTANIKRMLISRGLKEGEDFEPFQQERLRKQGGTSKKNIYMLTPDAFRVDVHPIG